MDSIPQFAALREPVPGERLELNAWLADHLPADTEPPNA